MGTKHIPYNVKSHRLIRNRFTGPAHGRSEFREKHSHRRPSQHTRQFDHHLTGKRKILLHGRNLGRGGCLTIIADQTYPAAFAFHFIMALPSRIAIRAFYLNLRPE